MSEPFTVSLEALAAQAMGEADAVSGDLVPPIYMSTTYERQTRGSYHQDRVYTRADNHTFEHTERLLAALEGGSSVPCSPPGWRRLRRSSSRSFRVTTSSCLGFCIGAFERGWRSSR